MPYLSLVPHQSAHSFVRVVLKNTPFITNGMSSMQIGFVQALLSKGNSRMSKKGLAGFVTFSTGLETASAAAPDDGAYFTPFCDVVLRFESLKRDFDGLMAKIGCPLRIPEQRKKARGNRLVPLLADDVVASVRRMYADDYALVERLAGLGLDDLLANATSA